MGKVIVIDDRRRFVDDRHAVYLETPDDGLACLTELHATAQSIDELYLDYSLRGGDVYPVLEWLRANDLGVGTIYPCSSSHSGRTLVISFLSAKYNVIDKGGPYKLGLA